MRDEIHKLSELLITTKSFYEYYNLYYNDELFDYLIYHVLIKYDNDIIDEGHRIDHIISNIHRLFKIIEGDRKFEWTTLCYASVIYHDIGLLLGDRKNHHKNSVLYVISDNNLLKFFTIDEILKIKEAVFNHRASGNVVLDEISQIVADSDRELNVCEVIWTAYLYRKKKYIHPFGIFNFIIYRGILKHLKSKYGSNGYMILYTETAKNMYDEESFDNITIYDIKNVISKRLELNK